MTTQELCTLYARLNRKAITIANELQEQLNACNFAVYDCDYPLPYNLFQALCRDIEKRGYYTYCQTMRDKEEDKLYVTKIIASAICIYATECKEAGVS